MTPSSKPASRRPPPAPKTRVIEVGGVTLNNRNPRTMCTVFTNDESGLPVTLDKIDVSGTLQIDPGECATDGGIENVAQCVDG